MEDKGKQQTTVKLENADGGIVVTLCHGDEEYKKIVYKDIKTASRAIPELFSVSEAESPLEDEKSLKKMKSKLPKETH